MYEDIEQHLHNKKYTPGRHQTPFTFFSLRSYLFEWSKQYHRALRLQMRFIKSFFKYRCSISFVVDAYLSETIQTQVAFVNALPSEALVARNDFQTNCLPSLNIEIESAKCWSCDIPMLYKSLQDSTIMLCKIFEHCIMACIYSLFQNLYCCSNTFCLIISTSNARSIPFTAFVL